jgi:hypothetical protein
VVCDGQRDATDLHGRKALRQSPARSLHYREGLANYAYTFSRSQHIRPFLEDFKRNALHTNAFSFTYEPSVGVAYRF